MKSIRKKRRRKSRLLRIRREKNFLGQISFVLFPPPLGCRLINSNRGYLSSLSMVNDQPSAGGYFVLSSVLEGIVRDEQVREEGASRSETERKFQRLVRRLVPFVLQPFVKVTRQSHPSALSPLPRNANSFASYVDVIDQSYSKIGCPRCYCDEIPFFFLSFFFSLTEFFEIFYIYVCMCICACVSRRERRKLNLYEEVESRLPARKRSQGFQRDCRNEGGKRIRGPIYRQSG